MCCATFAFAVGKRFLDNGFTDAGSVELRIGYPEQAPCDHFPHAIAAVSQRGGWRIAEMTFDQHCYGPTIRNRFFQGDYVSTFIEPIHTKSREWVC